jgi:hypothetical protein
MTLRPIKPGLRTIHNGSAFVAKASIVVPPGAELTVSDEVAEQLQRDGAFKDGPAPEPAEPEPEPEPEDVAEPEPEDVAVPASAPVPASKRSKKS